MKDNVFNKLTTNVPRTLSEDEVEVLNQTFSALNINGSEAKHSELADSAAYSNLAYSASKAKVADTASEADLAESAAYAQKFKNTNGQDLPFTSFYGDYDNFKVSVGEEFDALEAASGRWNDASSKLSEVATDPAGLLSGDGTQASPLGIEGPAVDAISAMASPFMIDGTNHIYVEPNSTTQKVVVGLDNAANNAIDYVGQMAHYWDEVSGVSGKSHATINANQVIEVDNNGTTSAVSAVQYVYNTGFHTAPKQMFVCQDDNDLIGNLGICQGKGTLFFVCSAI